MAKKTMKVEFTEDEVAKILASWAGIKETDKAVLTIYKYEGDNREPGYTTITLEGPIEGKTLLSDSISDA